MNSLEIYRSFLKILILPVKTGKVSLILAKKKKKKLQFGNILVYLHLKKNPHTKHNPDVAGSDQFCMELSFKFL